MKQLIVEGTKKTPHVELNPDGHVIIKGRCIMENPIPFFDPIFNWVKKCTSSALNVDIQLEYVNTGGVKQIFTLLLLIKDNSSIRDVYIHWIYEEGDDAIFELGKEIELQIKLPFGFFELSGDLA
ncbi:MAG TPA: DUF1987 domain-containing protein [Bacteroidales bacterium]